MAEKARHAFGSSSKIESALEGGIINERDILFLDEDTDSPKIGWVKKDGTAVILKDEKADLTELEAEVEKKADAEEVDAKLAVKADAADVESLEGQIATKVDAETVQTMIERYTESVVEVVEF